MPLHDLQEARIKQTLAGLDALLGIDPDEELKKKAAEEARKVCTPDFVCCHSSFYVIHLVAWSRCCCYTLTNCTITNQHVRILVAVLQCQHFIIDMFTLLVLQG